MSTKSGKLMIAAKSIRRDVFRCLGCRQLGAGRSSLGVKYKWWTAGKTFRNAARRHDFWIFWAVFNMYSLHTVLSKFFVSETLVIPGD